MINGNEYDWQGLEVLSTQGVNIGLQEISYSDGRPIEAKYGKGSLPTGYGRGNYEASGSMTLERIEAEKLRKSLGGSWYTKKPHFITVSYANHDQNTVTDVLKGVHIVKNDTSDKQGETAVGLMKFDFVILEPVEWNSTKAYSDGRDGAVGN